MNAYKIDSSEEILKLKVKDVDNTNFEINFSNTCLNPIINAEITK